jgi:hypothetical protein
MTQSPASNPSQQNTSFPAVADTRNFAALELGYYSRDINLDVLDGSLAILASEIPQNTFFALQQVIERLGTSEEEKELYRSLVSDQYELPEKWEDETRDVTSRASAHSGQNRLAR